jgi:hypothetical protein
VNVNVRKTLVMGFVLAGVVAMTASMAVAGENWIGTWKLNAAKSKLNPVGIKVETLKFEATPAGIKLTSEGADAQGKPAHASYTSKFDGKPVPWTGNPLADTAAPKKIDDNTYENAWTQSGKGTVTAKVSVSADGKSLTVTQTGKDASGAAVSSVAVYDKQ